MRVRPGSNLIGAIFALAVLSPCTFVFPQIVWLMLLGAIALGILSVLEYRVIKAMFAQVKITRQQPALVGRNIPFLSEIQITNLGAKKIVGELRDVLPCEVVPDYQPATVRIEAGGTVVNATELCISLRGRYELGPVWLRVIGPWRILEAQKSFDCKESIKVFPETFVSKDNLSQDQQAQLLMLDKMSQTRQHGAGTEFESLSEYRHGDDPRRIDWRTSARLGHPIVRRYQIERHRDVMVLVDSGRLMGAQTEAGSKLDCAVDSTLMLAEVALKHGDRCGVAFFDDRVRGYRTPVSGVNSVHSLAESIYDLQSQWRESDFGAMYAELQSRQTRRSLIVLLSDIVDVETSSRFRKSLARLAKNHVVLFAALRTPLLEQVIHSKGASLLDESRKAVAFRLLQQRQRVLHTLRHSGVHVMDVEPSQLTVPLINEFIDLRCQNLL